MAVFGAALVITASRGGLGSAAWPRAIGDVGAVAAGVLAVGLSGWTTVELFSVSVGWSDEQLATAPTSKILVNST
jgi:hypothetical protein